jgi:fructose-1,6-bisphosphatase I
MLGSIRDRVVRPWWRRDTQGLTTPGAGATGAPQKYRADFPVGARAVGCARIRYAAALPATHGQKASRGFPMSDNLLTLGRHLRAQKDLGPLVDVIEAIALAGKAIAHRVRRARIDDVIGEAGAVNVQGEAQQKLDVLSDQLLLECLRACPAVAVYASEEQDGALVLRTRAEGAAYCVLADPLDGSSNIDVAVSVGTIFSVQRHERPDEEIEQSAVQPGRNQAAAGYLLYGSSVVLVLSTGRGVSMYVQDPLLGDFVLVKEALRVPPASKTYSLNEAYVNDFEDGLKAYLDWAHGAGYGARYIGSMVADVHRTLLKGGVFLYPGSRKAPEGKLRLLYEASPMAFLMEQAGGAASTGKGPLLDVAPTKLHQRTPVVLGSSGEVEHVLRHLRG